MTIETIPVGALQTNSYLLDDGQGAAVLVDPGGETARLWAAVERRRLTVRAILLTHAHVDHFLAADALRTKSGAPLWIPAADEYRLTDPVSSLLMWIAPGERCPRPAERTLSEGETLTVGGITLTVWHTPGHTKGSSCFLAESERTVFTGDTLFAGGCGRTDFPGGSESEMRQSLLRLRRLAGWHAYPGHGAAFTI